MQQGLYKRRRKPNDDVDGDGGDSKRPLADLSDRSVHTLFLDAVCFPHPQQM